MPRTPAVSLTRPLPAFPVTSAPASSPCTGPVAAMRSSLTRTYPVPPPASVTRYQSPSWPSIRTCVSRASDVTSCEAKSGLACTLTLGLCTTADIPVTPLAASVAAIAKPAHSDSGMNRRIALLRSRLPGGQRIPGGKRPFRAFREQPAERATHLCAHFEKIRIRIAGFTEQDGHMHAAIVGQDVVVCDQVCVQAVEFAFRGGGHGCPVGRRPDEHGHVFHRLPQPALALDHAVQHHRVDAGVHVTPQPAAVFAQAPLQSA